MKLTLGFSPHDNLEPLATIDLGPRGTIGPDGCDTGDLALTSGNLYLSLNGRELGSLWIRKDQYGHVCMSLGSWVEDSEGDWVETLVLTESLSETKSPDVGGIDAFSEIVDAAINRRVGKIDAGTTAYVTRGGTWVLTANGDLRDNGKPQDLVAVLPGKLELSRVLPLYIGVNSSLITALRVALDNNDGPDAKERNKKG